MKKEEVEKEVEEGCEKKRGMSVYAEYICNIL